MFRKILIIAMFATAAGYCFAATTLPQVVTSEVFYTTRPNNNQRVYVAPDEGFYEDTYAGDEYQMPAQDTGIPVWPIAGSDADVVVSCDGKTECAKGDKENFKIVSKIGSDLVVENSFNMPNNPGTGWSGGANMLHGTQIPVGFDDECGRGSEMPLLHREVLEDDGGNVLAVSRSGRAKCAKYADGYDAYLAKNGLTEKSANGGIVTGAGVVSMNADGTISLTNDIIGETEISVDMAEDMTPNIQDQVRSWVVANGQTLREVLQSWCDKEGWDLVWATSREYPIQASAVFKGRFVDVASAVVRNFGRAIPVPYAKFYKGNRVLVVSTTEE
ncbi:MAG: toxin co-regulated pilus biosynthesis Q family protein [Alphaproteobacteria bacterium]|nr:toxin co-regulated pilus biosynthesis Q family protein [Alphaproteobacteria bacterium]